MCLNVAVARDTATLCHFLVSEGNALLCSAFESPQKNTLKRDIPLLKSSPKFRFSASGGGGGKLKERTFRTIGEYHKTKVKTLHLAISWSCGFHDIHKVKRLANSLFGMQKQNKMTGTLVICNKRCRQCRISEIYSLKSSQGMVGFGFIHSINLYKFKYTALPLQASSVVQDTVRQCLGMRRAIFLQQLGQASSLHSHPCVCLLDNQVDSRRRNRVCQPLALEDSTWKVEVTG